MPQYARPSADVDMSPWTCSSGSNRYALINEASADDDTNYIWRSAVTLIPTDSTVNLSAITNPGVTTGHVIRIRARLESAGSASLDCNLTIGGGNIALSTFTVNSTSYADFSYALSGSEAASITNYGALQLFILARNGGGVNVRVTQASFEAPDVSGSNNQRRRRGLGK